MTASLAACRVLLSRYMVCSIPCHNLSCHNMYCNVIIARMKTRIDEKVRATYKVLEAARVAVTGERAIRNGIAAGQIPHLRFGKNILIPRAAFHKWLDSAGQGGGRAA